MYINPDPCSIKSVRKEILTYSLLRSPICSVIIAATIATGSVLEARKKTFSAKPDFGRNHTFGDPKSGLQFELALSIIV